MRYALLLFTVAIAAAQQPRVSNAAFETRALSGDLASTIASIAAAHRDGAWTGYAVPSVPGNRNSCCYHSSDGWSYRGCSLEGNTGRPPAGGAGGPVQLEGPSHAIILYRVSGGAVEKVRSFTSDCELDAGGRPFIFLTGVTGAASVEYLKTRDDAINAIAMHGDPSAFAALEQMASQSVPKTREKALFWLANLHGKRGYDVVNRIARGDQDERIREKAIFALTQSKEPAALESIIGIARTDRSPRVRQQAMFWLGHSKDPRALQFIESILLK